MKEEWLALKFYQPHIFGYSLCIYTLRQEDFFFLILLQSDNISVTVLLGIFTNIHVSPSDLKCMGSLFLVFVTRHKCFRSAMQNDPLCSLNFVFELDLLVAFWDFAVDRSIYWRETMPQKSDCCTQPCRTLRCPSSASGRCFSWATKKLPPPVTTDGKIASGPAAGNTAGRLSLVSCADLGIIVVKKILSEWLTYSSQFYSAAKLVALGYNPGQLPCCGLGFQVLKSEFKAVKTFESF